jgi:uncharacterized protein
MKQDFFIRGTSCKSCEVLIERELIKEQDISCVEASHNGRCLSIETKNNREYTHSELNTLLEKHNYTIHKKDKKSKKNKEPINWQHVGAVAIFVLSLYIILNKTGLLQLSPSSAQPASLVGVFVIGLIASASSCTAVVGGLVIAVSSAVSKNQKNLTTQQKLKPHILFNLGRILGFLVLGGFIGYAGSVLQLSPSLNGIFVVAIAILMIIIGVNLMEVFPSPVIGMPKWLAHKIHDLAESDDPKAPMLLGAATFFLPCGFTQSMQLFALTLQDPLQSGIVMAIFALGTTPMLLGIASATAYTSNNTLKKVTQLAGLVVLILGMSNVTNGLTLLGINPNAAFAKNVAETGQEVSLINGKQQIEMDISPRGSYQPSTLTVQENIPVDWTINGADFMGCADTLILPAFGVNTTLNSGKNLIQFTPTKPGRYTFSCSMGMIRGTLIVTPAS